MASSSLLRGYGKAGGVPRCLEQLYHLLIMINGLHDCTGFVSGVIVSILCDIIIVKCTDLHTYIFH